MNAPVSRDQLKQTISVMVQQTELFPDSLNQIAEDLNQEDLEKLTITLHVAQKSVDGLNETEQGLLQESLKRYFDGKRRVYKKTQRAWLQYHEQKHEAQETLFEEALLTKI
jgi:uncharacterized protein YecT (DUF1311 family)